MSLPHNPDHVPTGRNSRDNEYYRRINHVQIAKQDDNPETFSEVVPVAPAVSAPPTISPASAIVDDQVFTRIPGSYTGTPTPLVTWVWRKGTTPIPGSENQPTYAPSGAGDVAANYNVFDTISNSADTVTSASTNAEASLRTQATMALVDQSFDENIGIQTYDFASAVTPNGNALVYNLVSPPIGVSIAGTVISINTDTAADGTQPITVRATDEYGRQTDDIFDLEIISAAVTAEFEIEHLDVEVPNNQVVTAALARAVTDVNRAFVLNNNSQKVSQGSVPAGGSVTMAPDELGVGVELTAVDEITVTRQAAALLPTSLSLSVLNYVGDPGGPNEFIVRDRRTVTDTGSGASFTPAGIVNADKCVPIVTGVRSSVNGSTGWDHGLAGVTINRSTGQVSVEGRGGTGTLTADVTTVEFTGSNWNVRYATDDTTAAQTGTLTLNAAVASWANAWILHAFTKNGSGNGGIGHIAAIYRPGSALNEVDWEFSGSYAGAVGERHTVFVIENPEMTVTRRQQTLANPATQTGDISVAAVGLTATTKALLYISTNVTGTGGSHPRGTRGIAFVDTNTVRHSAQNTGSEVNVEVQVIELPNVSGEDPPPDPPMADRAVGWGYNAVGGAVDFTVNSAANSGTGTLRDALSSPGRRVVFDLPASTVINVTSNINVPSNTFVDGRGQDIQIDSPSMNSAGALNLLDCDNVKIQNLKFKNIGHDAIQMVRATNVWVDHVEVEGNSGDGGIDIIEQSRFITVSNSYIHDQAKTMLIGSGNQTTPEDSVMRVTLYRNWWHRNQLRQPFLRRGWAHLLNNYYSDMGILLSGGSRAVESTLFGQTVAENQIYQAEPGGDTRHHDFFSTTIPEEDSGFLRNDGANLLLNSATDPESVPGNVFDPLTEYRAFLGAGFEGYTYPVEVANEALRLDIIATAGWQPASFWA